MSAVIVGHGHLVSIPALPASPAPISQAVVAGPGEQCWVSGQLPVDASGAYRPGSARDEAELAFENVFAVLEAAGFCREDLVFVEIAFGDLADLPQVNELFAQLFPEGRRPARTVYQAAALPLGARIKVHGVAVREMRAR